MENKVDMTPAVNQVIDGAVKNKVIDTKKLMIKYHTVEQLYTRLRVLFRLASALCPSLMFKSLKHYDEENDPIENFNNDFIVGIYTPNGPIAFHYKLDFLDEFSHIPFSDHAPLYDNYTEEMMIDRIQTLIDKIISGKSIEEIIDEINSNSELHESQKPKHITKVIYRK